MLFQLAFYRQYGETVATYESCSTSAYRHGRTETVRSGTMETKRTVELMEKLGTRPSLGEIRASMEKCSRVHNDLTKKAAMGKLMMMTMMMRVPSQTWKPGDLNYICPGPETAWNVPQKVRKPGQNRKFSRKHGQNLEC